MNDIEKQRLEQEARAQAEYDHRLGMARQRVQALSSLMIGETLQIDDSSLVMTVPGGWIFYKFHKANVSSTFVPAPREPGGGKVDTKIMLPSHLAK